MIKKNVVSFLAHSDISLRVVKPHKVINGWMNFKLGAPTYPCRTDY